MKKLLSTGLFTVIFLNIFCLCAAQDTSLKKTDTIVQSQMQNTTMNDDSSDYLIKAKLVSLALNNPQIDVENAQIKIAQYGFIKAKNSWLSSLSISSNINEFVINNTKVDSVPVASYYPKYNIGLTVPFDIFSKTKQEKNIATQQIAAARAVKQDRLRLIKEEVLTRYENYKEKKELVRLQKISSEGDNDSYIAAQKSYADGTMQLAEMNKTYQEYIESQSKLVSSQRDFNVAVIELEEMIGVPVDQALHDALGTN